MGLLNDGLTQGLGKIGLTSISSNPVRSKAPDFVANDFPSGMRIVEIKDGREQTADQVVLVGSFMPLVPFEFGGTQQLVKEYYPGNSEPTVQVLGSRESDVTINGRMNVKKLKDTGLRDAVEEYQQLIEAMRIRGRLVKIELGEWQRYGFIEEAHFKLKRLSDIEYSIKFFIVGFNEPKNYMVLANQGIDLISPNKDLTVKLLAALELHDNIPESMPKSISDNLNDLIGSVASAVNLVTGFVEGILDDAEKLNASANRALGLIKNARATISRSARRVGTISRSVATMGAAFTSELDKTVATLKNVQHINKVERSYSDLASYLESLRRNIISKVRTVPMRRHLVVQGDTLERISIKYYNTADNWWKIYLYNKLLSENLVKGTVLEIPKL